MSGEFVAAVAKDVDAALLRRDRAWTLRLYQDGQQPPITHPFVVDKYAPLALTMDRLYYEGKPREDT